MSTDDEAQTTEHPVVTNQEPATAPPRVQRQQAQPQVTPQPKPSDAVLDLVVRIRAALPSWRRSFAETTAETAEQTPSFTRLSRLLSDPGSEAPMAAADALGADLGDSATAAHAVGTHAQLLETQLRDAAKWWKASTDAIDAKELADLVAALKLCSQALDLALMHALFLTFLVDVRRSHVGDGRRIDSYCTGWGLTDDQVDVLWSWLVEDPLEFDGEPLQLALDTVNRTAYKKPDQDWFRWASATAALWGALVVFVLIALLFELLHGAGITTWPTRWVWKLLVLVVFVSLGALAHIASRAINVNYDDPMKIYDAGNIVEWLSLRWIAVLKMYLPVAFVVGSLWGAGNVPTTFAKLGTALLAGYSADSAVRAALSKLSDSDKGAAAKPAAATAATSAR